MHLPGPGTTHRRILNWVCIYRSPGRSHSGTRAWTRCVRWPPRSRWIGILVETDSPYLSPHPHRGQTNKPARVVATASRLAQIRGLSPVDFATITTINARNLFRLPDDLTLPARCI